MQLSSVETNASKLRYSKNLHMIHYRMKLKQTAEPDVKGLTNPIEHVL